MNLIEMSQAFGIFANQGVLAGRPPKTGGEFNIVESDKAIRLPHLDPVTVLSVEDAADQVLLDWETSYPRPIISPQLAFLMTSVLSDEMAR